MTSTSCYCGSGQTFENCCKPYIIGDKKPSMAEILMRSRYSAYANGAIDYLINTTASSERKYYSKRDIQKWASENQWQKLEIINATENTVEFKAYFLDKNLKLQIHHEKSTFINENGNWFYLEGIFNEEIC
jgi:SEC-C motif-containing protein